MNTSNEGDKKWRIVILDVTEHVYEIDDPVEWLAREKAQHLFETEDGGMQGDYIEVSSREVKDQ